MRIIIDVCHPSHVHLFKNFTWIMEKNGCHNILFTAREKEVTCDLLEHYKFNYISFGKPLRNIKGKLLGMAKFDYQLIKAAKQFKPDMFLSMASIYASHASFFLKKPHIAFEDSEPVFEHQLLYRPFTDAILTPQRFKKNFGHKQVRYNGFNEMAYLHPRYYKPDSSVFFTLDLNKNEKYALLRFVAFKASHDIGIKGFSYENKIRAVKELQKYGKVYISSEDKLPKELEKYQIKIPPSQLHDALFYASLYLGDSQTMATEAALLGTPVIRCNTWAYSPREMSNFIELERHYKLLVNLNIKEQYKAIDKAIKFFKDANLKKEWQKRRQKLFEEKIDVTAFLVWFMTNYPESFKIIKNNPNYQLKFK